ncbi:efflux RND transporter permease subunit [Helicobacter muridarum]|uniref:Cation efflux system protein (CzcA) n=1 Tax=Helicobacter muridarum TaxID=216 RepID=A0A099TVK9_9HELI|nr:CusA/CzcA family heavy metal efflux RND transporter [Helicobacter muridarum]TLE00591.1 efflux RND transporter permease subunit [Helicobacter muridarum]STQ85605.1 cation efflux system protein (czcA) [Helicobacter muridarum]
MIDSIISYSVKNRIIVVLMVIVLTGISLFSIQKLRLDALPDLSPPQVVIEINFPSQGPKIIQDQVTYPLVSELMAISGVETVRGISGYESGLIYVIFKDKTDLYWARSRILEQLNQVQNIPSNVKITLGSDSTSVGWAYQYVLNSTSKNLAELKSLQDFYYKYALLGIDGVSEVASIGGFLQNYEVRIDNSKLLRYDLSLKEIVDSISRANNDSGGGVIIEGGFEKIIRANGYIKNEEDLEKTLVKMQGNIPITLGDVADVVLVPKPRRGVADVNGNREVVGGIVMVKYNGNTYDTLNKIKEKIASLNANNPEVQIESVYDRSELIQKAILSLISTLIEESIIVLIVSLIFLLHLRSALVVVITLPLCVLFSALLMWIFNIESTIMSLGGIAIAIGAMVDAAIVMIENAHKNLCLSNQKNGNSTLPNVSVLDNIRRQDIIIQSAKQVGSPIFFALMIVVVSFLPIFALNGQEERLFAPLAYTKTFAMLIGAVLSITVVPLLMLVFIRGKIISEENNPINRFCIWAYSKFLLISLRLKWLFLGVCILMLGLGYFVYKNMNWEFMPQINEGVIMYMPVSNVAPSIDTSLAYLQKVDSIIKSFDEVEMVFGKAGRANTTSDPAPLSMLEVYIHLKPEFRFDSKKWALLRDKLESKLKIAGITNSWTYPIRGRTDMLLTGIRTPLGIKIYGSDTQILQQLSIDMESKLKSMNESLSVFAERANSGYYIDIDINDSKLARYGVSKDSIFSTINLALGGVEITKKINGIENYPISLRLQDIQRNDIESIKELYIKTALGFRPLRELANISYASAPMELKSEKGLSVNFIYITPKEGVSAKAYKQKAIRILQDVTLPNGYYYEFSGESEYIEKALGTLKYIIPLSLFVIFVLIFFALKNWGYTLLCFFSLPFAILGGLLAIDYLGFNLSIAGVVGLLALLGVASETSIVMLLYLEQSFNDAKDKFFVSEVNSSSNNQPLDSAKFRTLRSNWLEILQECVLSGAAKRVRPKLMTALSIIASLSPIMFSHGVGSEIMRAIAAPMLGGMITSTLLTLFIIPICFYLIKRKELS